MQRLAEPLIMWSNELKVGLFACYGQLFFLTLQQIRIILRFMVVICLFAETLGIEQHWGLDFIVTYYIQVIHIAWCSWCFRVSWAWLLFDTSWPFLISWHPYSRPQMFEDFFAETLNSNVVQQFHFVMLAMWSELFATTQWPNQTRTA